MPNLRRSLTAAASTLAAATLLTACFPDPETPPVPVFQVHINEIESNGGTPGDWVELVNLGPDPADVSGWTVLDNDDTHTPAAIPAGTTIPVGGYYVVEEAALGFGLGGADSVRLFDRAGSPYESTSWTAHAATTLGRCPDASGPFAVTAASTKLAANTCETAASTIRINEVESNGGTPGDWVELVNNGNNAADVSGWTVLDNDDTHTPAAIEAGTTIPAGGYHVVEESALGFGLGGADSARLFDGTGAPVDTVAWTAHAAVTLGRCPNGTGGFGATATATKGAVNSCTVVPGTAAWPGGAGVSTVDPAGVLGGNMSGLIYEGSVTGAPGTLWAVKNGPGTLYRLVSDGGAWVPEPGVWANGRTLKYGDGTGNPDAEGVTFAGGPSAGIFVATERNNDANSTSRNSILRFDPSASGATLDATNEWNLTADLPANGPNLGLEAITWVPDTELVAEGFVDSTTGVAYDPGVYPNHGTGLFFVGVEATGAVHAYALDLTGTGYTRVATIASGFVGVMELQFDRELGNLWAVCDDGCQGRSTVLDVNPAGAYVPGTVYDRPTGMPNLNNEGFGFAPIAECVSGVRPAFWADDGATGGNAIRQGTISCTVPVS